MTDTPEIPGSSRKPFVTTFEPTYDKHMVKFPDYHGSVCSITQGHKWSYPGAVWFGIYPVVGSPVSVLLTKEMVAGILPILQTFVETGRFDTPIDLIDAAQKQEVRERLFSILREAHGVELIISADGGGDSGDIDDWAVVVPPQYAGHNSLVVWGNVDKVVLGFDELDVLTKRTLTPTLLTVDKAIEELGWDILDDQLAPDWYNGDGGRAEIHIDLTTSTPVARVDYEVRVVTLEPNTTLYYDARTMQPIGDRVAVAPFKFSYLAENAMEMLELEDLQSNWNDAEEVCVTDPDEPEDC